MLKAFIKEGGLYSLSGVVTKGIGVLLIPFYTKVFSTGDYGMLDLITAFGGVVNIVFPLQITHGVGRYIADGKEKEKAKILYSSTGLWFTLIAYGLFLLLSFLFSGPILSSFLFQNTPIDTSIFFLACLSIALNGVFYFFQHQLKWIRKAKVHSILAISHSILTISLTIVLVLKYDKGIVGVFLASVITTPLFLALSYYHSREWFTLKFSNLVFKRMLVYSSPIVFQSLSLLVLTYADKVILKEIKNVSETGIYGIAFRAASIMHIIFTGFSYSLVPLIYGSYHEKGSNERLGRVFEYFVIFSFTGALCVSLFSLEILTVFTQPDYFQAYQIIPILCLVTLANGFQMFFHGLSLAKKTMKLASINIFAAVVNIGLNYLLIPGWGGVGAACATLIATLFNLVILAHFSQKEYKIPLRFLRILVPSLLITLIVAGYIYFEKEILITTIFLKIAIIIVFVLVLIKIIDRDKLIYSNLKKAVSNVRNRRNN